MILTRKHFKKLLPDLEETLSYKDELLTNSPTEAREELLQEEIQALTYIIGEIEEYIELVN